MTILADPIAAPVEQTTIMKPSEALRLGSLTTQQAFGVYSTALGQRCAVGTIADVLGWNPMIVSAVLDEADASCPDCNQAGWASSAGDVTVHLNDDHRWTRPQIADWLEGIGL